MEAEREIEIVEVEELDGELEGVEQLPEASQPRALEPVRRNLPDAKVATAAAASGVVVGAAAVVAVQIARKSSARKPKKKGRRRLLGRQKPEPLLSRSFLVDVHLLK